MYNVYALEISQNLVVAVCYFGSQENLRNRKDMTNLEQYYTLKLMFLAEK